MTFAQAQAERRQTQSEMERRRIDRARNELAKKGEYGLSSFIEIMWPVVEPGTTYVHGWHIDAISEHLEAVSRNEILRLLINVPPAMMKSLQVCVFFPAWEWGPRNQPHLRYLTTSYREDYAVRDSRRMRDIVTSELYQSLWGDRVQIDRDGERSFSNTMKGGRDAVPFASLTAGRGDRVIFDDPHSTETAESEQDRKRALRITRESLPTRINNPFTSAIIGIMQRLHQRDVSGEILAADLGYTHVMLPMEFEPDRKCRTYINGKLFFEDRRTTEGELLFPARFNADYTAALKKSLGPYATAGQLQQRPVPREGKMFKRHWFGRTTSVPADVRWVRRYDLADTEEQVGANPAWTVGLKLGYSMAAQKFYIGNVKRTREEAAAIRKLIRDTAVEDGSEVTISMPQDPGGAGKGRAKDMRRMLAAYDVRIDPETGSKIDRAEPLVSPAEAGDFLIVVPAGGGPVPEWVEIFLEEVSNFPSSAYKDQVDALSGAYMELIGMPMFDVGEDAIRHEGLGNIPGHWARIFAVDMDNKVCAAVWGAYDKSQDVVYIYGEYRVPKMALAVHLEAIRDRGDWIPGLFDMTGRGRTKQQGLHIADQMVKSMRNLFTLEVEEEQAVEEMRNRLTGARLRVFETNAAWFGEYRRWEMDEEGDAIEGRRDHLMRATALLCLHVKDIAVSENVASMETPPPGKPQGLRNTTTGY
jgi:predicted phage terminase large subunit-like protein